MTASTKGIEELLASQNSTAVPGVFNPISAILAEECGFQILYLSGAAFTASMGLPDIGIVTLPELRDMVRAITSVTPLPLIVDIDTGFGGTLNCKRTAEEMVKAGANAVQIEDQAQPKKCGHLDGKELIPAEEMVQKIKMIKMAAPDLMVVGRTDARGVCGLSDAIERARRYAKAGADIIFPEALLSREEFIEFRQNVPDVPLLANMTEFGKSPCLSVKELESLGYQLVLFPVSALRVANFAMAEFYRDLIKNGTQAGFIKRMQTRDELYKTIHYADYENMDRSLLGK
jgi:methylisocitrate lyase